VGTIAYLTAVDEENNVVTVGEARIELREYQRDGIEKNQTDDIVKFENDKLLIPSVVPDGFAYNTTPTENYVIWNADHNGEAIIVGGNTGYTSPIWKPTDITNEIDKMVFVKNTGNCNVYVRICFAFEAGNYVWKSHFDRMVHLNKNETDWTWTWDKTGDKVNLYDIDGTRYFIAWATYTHVLPAGEHTKISLSQIALDFSAINEHSRAFGEKYEVKAFAQGIQADGFDSASAAIAKGFDDTIPFKNCKFVEFTDLKTALHYLDGVVSDANKITSKVTNVIFGLTKDHSAKVAGRKGVLVANKESGVDTKTGAITRYEADFTAYAYYVPIAGGTQYDIYVLADDWKIYAPADSTDLFSNMTALTKVDTSILDVSNVTNALRMFNACKQLVELDTSDWKFPNLTTVQKMFYECALLEELDVSGWGITNALKNIEQAFEDCNALKELDCSGWDVSNVTTMQWAFRDCMALTKLDVSGWEVGQVGAFTNMFTNCISLKTIPVDTWTWENITDEVWQNRTNKTVQMNNLFSNCSSLTSLDLSTWEVGRVTKMDHMFVGCTSLTSVNVGGWNVGNVSTITNMFNGCYKLSDLDLSSWKFVNVSDMTSMFQNCFALKTIDLSGWDMGNNASGISMNMMFKMEPNRGYTSELATIYVNKSWTNTKISSSTEMFLNCTNLSGYSASAVDASKAHTGEDGYLSEKKK
jgi:surface protein